MVDGLYSTTIRLSQSLGQRHPCFKDHQMKMLHTTLTIEEAITLTANALEQRVAPRMAHKALMLDGFTFERAEKIVQWAKQYAKRKAS